MVQKGRECWAANESNKAEIDDKNGLRSIVLFCANTLNKEAEG